MNRGRILTLSIAILLTGAPISGRAQITILSNPGAFAPSDVRLTFAGVSAFENVTTHGGVGFRTLGFPPGTGIEGASDPTPLREFGSPEGTILNQFRFGTAGVEFTVPWQISRFSFELYVFPNVGGVLQFDLFAGSGNVASFSVPSRGTADYLFYGFSSSVAFDRVVLRGPGDGRFGLDNLMFGPVPEPAPGVMLSVGLLLIALVPVRRRARFRG
jgi:hypothetical protein